MILTAGLSRQFGGLRGLTMLAVVASASDVAAQELVRITVPSIVSFQVTNVSQSTSGSPGPTQVGFSNAVLLPFHVLRISVRADGDITGSGSSIPASKVSWTTSNVSNGVAFNGTLSTSYTEIFQSSSLAISGGFDATWTLAAPGTPLRAANHQVTLRWKLEAVSP